MRLRILSCCLWVGCCIGSQALAAPSKSEAPETIAAMDAPPAWQMPPRPTGVSRISRADAAAEALRSNAAIDQAKLALARAKTEQLRAKGRHDGVFRTALDAMRAETPVDSGISRGTNRQDLLQLQSSLSRRFDSGTLLSMEMQNGYTRTVFPLVISGVLQQRIDSGPNYLNSLTLSLQQSLLEGRSRRSAQSVDIAAQLQVEIAEAQLQAAQEQIVEQVMATWSQVFFAEVQVALQERSIERTQQQVQAADAQLQAGHIATFERNLVWQRLAQNHEALLIAHKELRASARALLLLLGRATSQGQLLTNLGEALYEQPTDTPFTIDDEAHLLIEADQDVNNDQFPDELHQTSRTTARTPSPTQAKTRDKISDGADRWCEKAMQQNADLQIARAQLRLAESMLLPAEEQQRAQLDLKFGVTSSGLDPDMGESLKKMATVDALTIFGGVEFVTRLRNRSAKAEVEGAQIDLATARAQETHLREQVCFEVVDAYESMQLQQERRSLSEWRTQIAYQSLAAESARFERGRSTVTLVLDALENVELSELEHLRVRLEEDAALWSLMRKAGRILDALGSEDL